MKILLSLSMLLFSLIAKAQLNNRFYSNGNPNRIAALGAYGANTFIDWRKIQSYPDSSFNWKFCDMLVHAYQAAGLHLMLTLSCTHPVNKDDSTKGTCAFLFSKGGNDNNSNWPVIDSDTAKWKQFVYALVDRYDGDGINDMPGLIFPVNQWHIIGQEWSRVWCDVPYTDSSLLLAKSFVKLVNMTYKVIKAKQPQSTISYAGIDIRNQSQAFYDGYFPLSQTFLCNNINNCTSPINSSKAQFAASPKFLPGRRNIMYIFKNALSDEIDLHEYGRWQNIPDIIKWVKDSTYGKPVIFMEGGGPFCPACEKIYHNAADKDGILPSSLVRDNACFVVYYFLSGLAADVKKLHWNLPNEYATWGATWGDLDLQSSNDVKKPSYFVYRFLAQKVFANAMADTVIRVLENNPAMYHFRINPLTLDVAWSNNAKDSIVIIGSGKIYRWDIPVTCNSIYPAFCDSAIQKDSAAINGAYTIYLNDKVPVFYSLNNDFTGSNPITHKPWQLTLYPNPAENTVNIDLHGIETTTIVLKITDVYGRKVFETTIQSNHQTLDLKLPDGMYFYQATNNISEIAAGKLLIQPH